jgi:hypothetical protein
MLRCGRIWLTTSHNMTAYQVLQAFSVFFSNIGRSAVPATWNPAGFPSSRALHIYKSWEIAWTDILRIDDDRNSEEQQRR